MEFLGILSPSSLVAQLYVISLTPPQPLKNKSIGPLRFAILLPFTSWKPINNVQEVLANSHLMRSAPALALNFVKNTFIYLFLFFGYAGSSLLCRLFSNCGKQELLFIAVHRLLIVMASLVAEHRL